LTRLDRIIKGFNDYDNFIKDLQIRTNDNIKDAELSKLRHDVSLLIGELRRYGCRRER
jgi:hypothetical protein